MEMNKNIYNLSGIDLLSWNSTAHSASAWYPKN